MTTTDSATRDGPAFKYRYVGYGTNFTAHEGDRPEGNVPKQLLFDNELALDVGGTCWGLRHAAERPGDAPEGRAVLDHHFYRKAGQFPSAAAAVLHNAARIHERFHDHQGVIWLVAHQEPDFDAYSAMHLARGVLSGDVPHDGWEADGLHPDGWLPVAGRDGEPWRIDWYSPRVAGLPAERRWAILLASCAAHVDNGRRMACARHRSLHAVLYAAQKRGRDYQPNGAAEFFAEVKHALVEKELNPLCDSVLEGNPIFAPELALLDREEPAYQRDVLRARRALVYVPKTADSTNSSDWFERLRNEPLLECVLAAARKESGAAAADQRAAVGEHHDARPPGAEPVIRRVHLHPTGQTTSAVDGIYLRDPECLLFKEWARLDYENSSLGQGFLFTAVAYSGGRGDSLGNTTDYYFSLDPERARGRHLYNVWARLQAEEVAALVCRASKGRPPQVESGAATEKQVQEDEAHQRHGPAYETSNGPGKSEPPRQEYKDRARGFERFFKDPWYDGETYRSTIVATPRGGTFIGVPVAKESPDAAGNLLRSPGTAHDLGDDCVVEIVRQELELSVFKDKVTRWEFLVAPAAGHAPPAGNRAADGDEDDDGSEALEPHESSDRFGMAEVHLKSRPAGDGTYRFCLVPVDESVSLSQGSLAQQLGRQLWTLLESDLGAPLPGDFVERHLVWTNEWVGVWGRRGVAVAYHPAAATRVKGFLRIFRGVIKLAREVETLGATTTGAGDAAALARGQRLTVEAARTKSLLALPEGRLLSLFFEAGHLDEVLTTLHEVNLVAAERAQGEKIVKLTESTDATLKETKEQHANIVKLTQSTGATLEESKHLHANIEWAETFIIAYYAVDLLDRLAQQFQFDGDPWFPGAMVGWFLLVLVVTCFILQPFRHAPLSGMKTLGLLLLATAMGVLLAWGIASPHSPHPADGKHADKPAAGGIRLDE